MKLQEPVSKIMTTDLCTIDLSNSIVEAKNLLEKEKVRHLPVIDQQKLVGILSLTDILRLSFGEIYGRNEYDIDAAMFEMLSIEQVMRRKPHTVNADSPIKDVVNILIKEEFHALPVVNREQLVGIITTTDLIKFLAEETEKVELAKD